MVRFDHAAASTNVEFSRARLLAAIAGTVLPTVALLLGHRLAESIAYGGGTWARSSPLLGTNGNLSDQKVLAVAKLVFCNLPLPFDRICYVV